MYRIYSHNTFWFDKSRSDGEGLPPFFSAETSVALFVRVYPFWSFCCSSFYRSARDKNVFDPHFPPFLSWLPSKRRLPITCVWNFILGLFLLAKAECVAENLYRQRSEDDRWQEAIRLFAIQYAREMLITRRRAKNIEWIRWRSSSVGWVQSAKRTRHVMQRPPQLDLSCEICYESYDAGERRPKVICQVRG